MPSKKLPSRVQNLFEGARRVNKDGDATKPIPVTPFDTPPSNLPGDLTRAMTGWTWEIDPQGIYVFCSSEVQELLGCLPQDLVGQPLYNSEFDADGNHQLVEAIRTARPFTDLHIRTRRPNGEVINLVLTGHPVCDKDGNLTGYHGASNIVAAPLSETQALPVVKPPSLPVPLPAASLSAPLPMVTEPPAVSAPPEPQPEPVAPPEPPAPVILAEPEPPAPSEVEPQKPPPPTVEILVSPGAPIFEPEPEPKPAEPSRKLPIVAVSPPTVVAPVVAPSVTPLPRPEPAAIETPAPELPAVPQPVFEPEPPQPRAPVWGYLAKVDRITPLDEFATPEMQEAVERNRQVVRQHTQATGPLTPPGRSVATPIRQQGQLIGVLNFFDESGTQTWSEDDLALTEAVADQLALALENAHLFNETRSLLDQITREQERLALLYDMLRALSGSLEIETLVDTALQFANRLGAQSAYMVWGESETDLIFRSTLPGLERLSENEARDMARQLTRHSLEQWVIPNQRALVVKDTQLDQRWNFPTQLASAVRSVISVPMRTPRRRWGALAYLHTEPNGLTEEQLPLITSLVSQVAVALENAQLYQQVRIQQRNASNLARATQAMSKTLNESEFMRVLADELFTSYQAEGVVIYKWDVLANTLTPQVLQIAPTSSHTNWPTEGIAFPISQRPDLHNSMQHPAGAIHPLREEADNRIRESMLMPLVYSGEVEGVVEIIKTCDLPGLDQNDLDLFQAILLASASALQTVRLYELQRQTAERLTEVDRIKSQFLANMSHELRTPLNSIIGFSRVVLKGIDGPLTDTQTQDISSIYNSGQHLLGLINNILDMSKIEAGKMELIFDEVDLHDPIRIAMSTAVALVKDKPITLREDVPAELPTVYADNVRIRQVLLNLLSNAAKFTESGSITVRARPVKTVGPRSNRQEPFVEISITDTGQGIAPEDMHKLFEQFSQVDASATRKAGGTGLGLSICRSMIELHGGRIWAESQVGVGTAFFFILPLHKPEVVSERGAPPEAAEQPLPPPTVLVIDDDQGVMALYRRYLEPHGYHVISLDKGSEALARASETEPIAILLDIIMPNKDGWQVLSELKQNEATRQIPVIMCTMASDPERAYNLGAADYLHKPILETDLLQALDKVRANGQALPHSSVTAKVR